MRAAPSPNGHLARLVQRTRPSEVLLQRRQPSMFEHLRPGVPAYGAEDEPVDAMVSTPPSAPRPAEFTAARETSSRRPEPDAIEATWQRPPVPVPVPAQAPVSRQALPLLRETLRIDSSVRSLRTVFSPTERPAGQAAPVDGAPAPRSSPGRRREEPVASLAHPSRERAAPSLARPATAANPSTPLLRPSHTASVPSLGLPRATQPAPAVQPSRRQQAVQAPPPRELPPVQVTIGRIEVRAAAAPAVAGRSSAKAAPRLGLEQYLRERHGGRR